ncbi:MAG: hypothetical protein JWQ65_405 [Devosia sp.]|nr:hypothetical protein [Devosia sp.]
MRAAVYLIEAVSSLHAQQPPPVSGHASGLHVMTFTIAIERQIRLEFRSTWRHPLNQDGHLLLRDKTCSPHIQENRQLKNSTRTSKSTPSTALLDHRAHLCPSECRQH